MEIYFVSYNVQGENSFGFGNVEVEMSELITHMQSLREIARSIEDKEGLDFKSVVVINYKHLRTE